LFRELLRVDFWIREELAMAMPERQEMGWKGTGKHVKGGGRRGVRREKRKGAIRTQGRVRKMRI